MAGEQMLRRLEPLVGEWDTVLSVGGKAVLHVRTTFEWIEDGALLLQRADAEPPGPDTPPEWIEHSPFPIVSVIGADDVNGRLVQLYTDGRGVHRVYEVNVEDGVLRMWREQDGFDQRFAGTISDDGRTITGAWERSEDGETWEHDFDLVYSRVV